MHEENYKEKHNIKIVTFNKGTKLTKVTNQQQMSLISRGYIGNMGDDQLEDEFEKLMEEVSGYTMMVHEFLYLLCNASDRIV